MKRVYRFLPFILLPLFLFSCRKSSPQNIAVIDQSHIITVSNFNQRYQEFIQSTGIRDNRPARFRILDNMIAETLLLDVENNDQLLSDPQVKQGLELIENELILAFYKSREVLAPIEITDAELKSAFAKMNVQLAARHLFTRDESEAWRLYQALQNGATFEQLAPAASGLYFYKLEASDHVLVKKNGSDEIICSSQIKHLKISPVSRG